MNYLYVCRYISNLDENIKHAERVINGSMVAIEWWKRYRHLLLKLMLKHQLLEFDRN